MEPEKSLFHVVRVPVWYVQANTDVEMSFLLPLEMGKILWGKEGRCRGGLAVSL